MSQKGIQTAYNKASKKSYTHLNYEEKKLIKINESLENIERFLGHLWNLAPRNKSNSVNWKLFEKENEQNYKSLIRSLKEQEKLLNSKNKLIEKYNLNEDQVLNLFMKTQFRVGQSF